jgi:hypothetical protein
MELIFFLKIQSRIIMRHKEYVIPNSRWISLEERDGGKAGGHSNINENISK